MNYPENIATLCGSTRFKEDFERENRRLTLEGWIVLAPGVFRDGRDWEISESQKKELNELHKRKIELSSMVFVINRNGYIGESTTREIEYALDIGIEVYFMEMLHSHVAIECRDCGRHRIGVEDPTNYPKPPRSNPWEGWKFAATLANAGTSGWLCPECAETRKVLPK